MTLVSLRVDGGANCHVLNEEYYFIVLYKKEINCTLACGEKSRFQGVGIAIAELSKGNYCILAPAYLSTKDDVCTISPGALKRYSKCKQATHEPLEYLSITTSSNQTIKIKSQTAAGLDYIKLPIHHFKRPLRTKQQRHPFLRVIPKQLLFRSRNQPTDSMQSHEHADDDGVDTSQALQKAGGSNSSSLCNKSIPQEREPQVARVESSERSQQQAMYFHIRFGHQNMDYIRELAKQGIVKGIPKNLPDLKYQCPICKICKGTRIPRGGPVDHTQLPKGARIHADFIIFNTESCRQFKSALLITEATTRMKWAFTTRSRNVPVQQFRFLVNHLRQQGYSVNELRVDEDGALARSTNFMKLCHEELNMAVQSTGGYNSENNGLVESPIRPIKQMVRAFLVGAGLPDKLWCYAFIYAVYILNHRYNRAIKTMPIVKWRDANYEVNPNDMYIFGSKCYIINAVAHKKQLQMRADKDPRDYMGMTVDESELPLHFDGFFVGYASHSTVILVYDPETETVKRCHHGYVDEYNVRVLDTERLSPNSVLLQDLPPAIRNEQGTIDPRKIKVVSSTLKETKHKVDPEKSATITITLPPKGTSLGLTLKSDETYGFPVLTNVSPTSPLRTQIPQDLTRNCWIIAINSQYGGHIEPITAKYCNDELIRLQVPDQEVVIQLTFHRKINPVTTELNTWRMVADQANPTPPIIRALVAMPQRPVAQKSIFQCLQSDNRAHWKQGLFDQYDKNAEMMLLSAPLPKDELPPNSKIYQSVMACQIKEKGKDLYEFATRHCLNGSPMEKGKDFDFSCSPTISHPALRMALAVTAATGRHCKIIDVKNCFQCDAIEPHERLFITTPPCYIEWFKMRYPNIKIPEADKYVLQTLNGMQGRRDAGRSWYLLLKSILEDFGFKPCHAEPALFLFIEGNESLIVVTSTDDFLCCCSNEELFGMFANHLARFVAITVQTGHVLKYLNIRIVQTDQGISIEQTHHIQSTILEPWFPTGKTKLLTTADTPFRTDPQYERELLTQLPAVDEALTKLEQEYGGKYNQLIGQVLHVAQVTRFDISFAVSRLGQHNAGPNEAAFQGIKRIGRYLATHLHTPIFYPSLKFNMHQKIRFEYEPGKFDEQLISNLLIQFVDSDHARDIKTRKSMTCIIVALLGVIVHWHMGKQTCIAAHSTDAEVRAFYTATLLNGYLRSVAEYLQIPMQGRPTDIYEDNQPAIDIIEAGQITSRVKHMATAIAIIHEEYKKGTVRPVKIKGTLNPSDMGTKPLPSTSHHRHFRQMRGQRYYPSPTSLHGELMQVSLVVQRHTEFDSEIKTKINFEEMRNKMAVYDGKETNEYKV